MKILITGSAGYIGSCLFEYLKRKYDIIIPQMNGINLKRRVNFLKKFDKFENPI